MTNYCIYLFSQTICAFYSDCVKVAALRLLTPSGPFIFSPHGHFSYFPWMIKKNKKQSFPRRDLWPQSATWTDLYHRCYSTLAKLFGQPSCWDGNHIGFLKGERLFSRAGQRKLSRPGWRVPGPSAPDGACQCLTPAAAWVMVHLPNFGGTALNDWRRADDACCCGGDTLESLRASNFFPKAPDEMGEASCLSGALTVLLQGFI